MSAVTHVLYESATGLALFSSDFHEEVGHFAKTVQDSLDDISKFGKMVKLVSFVPFKDAAHALEVANDVSEGKLFFCFGSREHYLVQDVTGSKVWMITGSCRGSRVPKDRIGGELAFWKRYKKILVHKS